MTAHIRMIDERSAVRHGGLEVCLSPREFSITARIAKAKNGISPERLFNAEFESDPEGGPLSGRRLIHSMRIHINRKLANVRLIIGSSKPGAGAVYELRRLQN